MSVRLFAGYFLALATCAIIAFGSAEPEPAAVPFSAEAGMMPMVYSGYAAVPLSVHQHMRAPKRIWMADAQ